MLITTCTHCLARFKVTPQQLNLRQGQVRCGRCSKVFSGFEALERFPDDDTGSRILAARAAAAASGKPIPEIEPIEDLELLRDELETLETPGDPPTAPAPPVQPPPAPPTPSRAAEEKNAIDALVASLEAPLRAQRVSRAWLFGCALLALVFAFEVVYAFRAQLAQAYPITRPWLEAVCEKAGCDVPWVNDHALLKLEDSELLEVPGRPNEIALGARIRNLAATPQEFPYLELTLTDLSGQAAARRVLRPADYLGRAAAPGEVMAAGSELALQLRLETPRIKATGYELLLFYP